MDSMDFQLRLKPVMDVSDIQGNLGTLQQYLNKLKLPDSMKSGFKETFTNAEKEITKIQDILGKNTKTKGDVLGLEKSFGNLDKYLNKLSTDMSKLSGKKVLQGVKFDTPEIQKTIQQISDLKQKMSALTGDEVKQVTNAIDEMRNSASKISNIRLDKILSNIKMGNITGAQKEIDNLTKYVEKLKTKSVQADYDIGIKKMQAAIDSLNSKAGIDEIIKDIQNLDTVLDGLNADELEKSMVGVGNSANGVKTLADNTRQLGTGLGEATAKSVDLNNQIAQLKDRVKYFFSLTNAVQLFRRALRDAFNEMKELDAVMTETAVVTSFDVGDMWEKLPEYTENANKLGVSIKSMYEASTLYYQQGLKTNEVMEVSNETLKMARIAGMEAADATDRMTAALRGFNMEINEASAQRVNDVYSKLAAITASNTDEISNAMTKTASIAASAGMEFETTSAFLAQMIETTREAPENLGTALKTIIARFTEMKESPTDIFTDSEGEEVNVNKVDAALRSVGVSLKDATGQFRDLDDVFIDLAAKWDKLDVMQQRYVATTAAGSRQQSRFIAMMSNYNRTMELVSAANGSAGASQLQYEKTLDSLETKLAKLQNAWTTFTQTLLDSTLVKAGVDILTLLLETINKISSALDGLADGTGAIASLGIAILAFKGGNSLLNKGLDSILSTFLGKVSVTAEVAGETAAFKFQKGAEKGNAKAKTSIWSGVGTAGKEGGFKAGANKFGSNVSNKWNNARYYGKYDDFLNNKDQIETDISWAQYDLQNTGSTESITKLGKSYGYSGKELEKFTSAVQNGGSKLDGYTAKIAKNQAGIIDQAKAIGKSIGQMAAVAAAVIVVTNAIKLVDKAIKTASEKIAEISAALEEVNGEIAENQEILDNYEETKNNYDDMVKSLNTLKEGTAEWNQNLLKVNSQTQEILSKYPELIKYVDEVNGAQVLSNEGWLEYQNNVTETLQKQYGIQSGLNNQLTNSQLTKNLEGMEYSNGKSIATTTITSEEQGRIKTGTTVGGVAGGVAGAATGGILGGMAAGAVTGTALGTAIPGIGNAIGLIVGAIVGAAGAALGATVGAGIGSIGTKSGVSPEDAVKLGNLAADEGFVAENASQEQINSFIAKAEEAGIALGDLKDVIKEDGAAFDQWVNENVQAELQKESQRDALISNVISQNERLSGSDMVEYVRGAADIGFDDYDERFAEALSQAEDLGEDQLKSQYATLMGLTSDEIEAKLESKELSEETMQQTIAANTVQEELNSTMEKTVSVFESLNAMAKKGGDTGALAGAVQRAFLSEGKGMTSKDIETFDTAIEKSGSGYSTITGLNEAFKEGDITSEELTEYLDSILQSLGTSLETLGVTAEEFLANVGNADDIRNKLISDYGKEQYEAVQGLSGKDNLLGTSGQGMSIGMTENLLKTYGLAGVDQNALSSVFENIFSQVTEDNYATVMSMFENTNFADTKEIDSFISSLEAAGIECEKFENDIINATNATHDYTTEELQSIYATKKSVSEGLSERETSNVTFTEDEKNELIAGGVSEKHFTQLGNDWIYTAGTTNDILLEIKKDTSTIANREDGEGAISGTSPEEIDNTIEVFDAATAAIAKEEGKAAGTLTHLSDGSTDEERKAANELSSSGEAAIVTNSNNKTGEVTSDSFVLTREQLAYYDETHGTAYEQAWKEGTIIDLSSDTQNDIYDYFNNLKQEGTLVEHGIFDSYEAESANAVREALRVTGNYADEYLGKLDYQELVKLFKQETGKDGAYSAENLEEKKEEAEKSDSYALYTPEQLNIKMQEYYDKENPIEHETKVMEAQSEQLKTQAVAYGVSQQAIEDYNKALKDENKLNDAAATATLAARVAAEKQKKAIKVSADNLKKYNEDLKKYEKGTNDYEVALEGITDTMNSIMGTNVDFSFFEDPENMQLYQDAINGVDGAWEQLQNKMLAKSLESSPFLESLGLGTDDVEKINGNINNIQNALNNLTYDADGKVDLSALYNQLIQTGLSAEAAQKMLAGMGFSYDVTTETKTEQVPTTPEERQRGMGDYKNQEITLVTGYKYTGETGTSFKNNLSDNGSSGGNGSSKSTPQKNTKKSWHYNRDIKSEKRDNKMADIEHKIAMEQTKQIPNLKTLNKLHEDKLKLLQEEAKQSKANYDAAEKEEDRLWKKGKKKGWSKLINKDGTVNLKAYNSKKWKNEKEKEAFDEWESKLEDTRDYKQAQKESEREAQLSINEYKNARSEYTRLTNLAKKYETRQQKINDLQTKYNLLLNKASSTAGQLAKNMLEQYNLLKQQKTTQENIFSAAKTSANNYKKQSGIKQYIQSTDFQTGEVLIDYKKLNKDIKKGLINKDDADDAISKYQEFVDQAAEANSELLNIQNEIAEMKTAALESAADTQGQIREAIIQARQETIDSLSNIDSSINDTNSKILNAVQSNIAKLRQDRKNEKTEEDLAKKETRLAYLRQYSGGGNAVEIAKLEDEIAKGQEDYTDTLIDQKISELQDQNDKASEQRQRQIKILEKQLAADQENRKITQEIAKLWLNGEWVELLKKANNYENMTDEEKKSFNKTIKEAAGQKIMNDFYQGKLKTQSGTPLKIGASYNGATITGVSLNDQGNAVITTNKTEKGMNVTTNTTLPVNESGQIEDKPSKISRSAILDTHTNAKGDKTGGQKVGDFVKLKDETYNKVVAENNAAYGYNGNKNVFKIASIDPETGEVELYTSPQEDKDRTISVDATDIRAKNLKASDYKNLKYVENNADMLYQFKDGIKLEKKTGKDGKYTEVKNSKQWKDKYFKLISETKDNKIFRRVGEDGKITSEDKNKNIRFRTSKNPKNIKQYKTGGLADFTGPAWLDGTKTKPEIILNSRDTENFIQLKNILADVMRNTGSISNQSTGDFNCEVHINVEKMTSDYDVDQVAKRVKKILNDDGRYRTVNQINRLR